VHPWKKLKGYVQGVNPRVLAAGVGYAVTMKANHNQNQQRRTNMVRHTLKYARYALSTLASVCFGILMPN